MKREPLLALLREYRARYPDKRDMVDRALAFVATHERCFERSLATGHITGSAWVVSRDGTRVLLTHHAKLNRWLQPGGHADGDPDVLRVALREAEEETGLPAEPVEDRLFDVDIHVIPARGAEPAHDHVDMRFAVRVDDARPFVVSHESHDLAWVPVDRLTDFTREPSMLRMAAKWLRRPF